MRQNACYYLVEPENPESKENHPRSHSKRWKKSLWLGISTETFNMTDPEDSWSPCFIWFPKTLQIL